MFNFFKKNNDCADNQGEVKAFLCGKVIPIEEVKDGVFSEKVLGDGLAIIPTSENLCAPYGGVVTVVMEESGHACGMKLDNGMEILLHIGLDTVNMNHEGFEVLVKAGDKVKQGDALIRFDRKKIREAGYRDVTIMVISDMGDVKHISMKYEGEAVVNETTIMSFEK